MVVSLLSTTIAPVGTQHPAPADHRFVYPTVRPIARPASERREDARAW